MKVAHTTNDPAQDKRSQNTSHFDSRMFRSFELNQSPKSCSKSTGPPLGAEPKIEEKSSKGAPMKLLKSSNDGMDGMDAAG